MSFFKIFNRDNTIWLLKKDIKKLSIISDNVFLALFIFSMNPSVNSVTLVVILALIPT